MLEPIIIVVVELKKAFSVSIAKKHRKRVSSPFFYSSQTIYLLNKSETIKRRLEKDWTLSDSLKVRENQKELSESIELETSFKLLSFKLELFQATQDSQRDYRFSACAELRRCHFFN